MRSNYNELGKYIREVNERNSNLAITNLLGVSMEKTFIPSVANLNGVDLSIYKILRKNQLACKLMSVGRDEKLPVDLYKVDEPAIVSSAYYVFEPINKEELLPEYLIMWLCRPENDRYIGFISGGDVRGGISWEVFCSLPIKVPSITKQREIVKEYNTIEKRIALNQQLIQKLEETAQAIYKQWFVDFEFPNENGKPYKSNGGEMEWNEELGKEIPSGWRYGGLNNLAKKIYSGGTPSTEVEEYWHGEYNWFSSGETGKKYILETEKTITKLGIRNSTTKKAEILSTVIATAGQGKTRGQSALIFKEVFINQSVIVVESLKTEYAFFIFLNISSRYDELRNDSDAQSIRGSINSNDIKRLPTILPNDNLIAGFHKMVSSSFEIIANKMKQNNKLIELKELLLSKLATIEN